MALKNLWLISYNKYFKPLYNQHIIFNKNIGEGSYKVQAFWALYGIIYTLFFSKMTIVPYKDPIWRENRFF